MSEPSPTVARVSAFRHKHFSQVSQTDWDDWRWQMRNRLRTYQDFARIFELSDDEAEALRSPQRPFSVGVTPYYASLLDAKDPDTALRRTMIPVLAELQPSAGDMTDPLAEDAHAPVPGIVHRYPDRVLFLANDVCPVYCRYCTRSRLVGGNAPFNMAKSRWQQGIDYIAKNDHIHDVLISGGDPLILSDERLEWLISRLAVIPHLDFIRLGSKVPIVLPQRVTPALATMLRRYHPLYMSIHVTHPDELTAEAAGACGRLADAGIPLASQTVLLKGVNDSVGTMRRLMRGMLRARIKPYYLLQCDPISGSGHLRTPLRTGIEMIRGLRGHISGYGVPHYIVDLPGGGGKIALTPEHLDGYENGNWLATNSHGKGGFQYPDPVGPPLDPTAATAR